MASAKPIDASHIASILDRLEFFSGFSSAEKARIAGFYTHFSAYRPGDAIITEGDAADLSFFILLAGTVSITKGRKQLRITRLEPGDVFGEATFLTGLRRTTNVVADDVVIVIRLDRQLMEKMPGTIREKIKDCIIERLVKRLDNMNKAYLAATKP